MKFQMTFTDKLRDFNNYVDVKQTQDNGVLIGEYKMTLNDIIRALSNSATEGKTHETPMLPQNCIKLVTTINGYEVFIDLPKRQWQIIFNDKPLMLGFPRLILKYVVVGNRIHRLNIVATKETGAITEDTELYYFPYSNVHHESGSVCMGMNAFPNIEYVSQVEKMHILFFSSPFGTDYGAMALGMDLSKLLKEFEDKSFNDDLLIPMTKTFSEFFLLTKQKVEGAAHTTLD